MRDKMNKITIYILAIAVFFVIILLSISSPIVVNEGNFSIYNSGGNGCSDLAVKTREMDAFTQNIEFDEGRREVTQKELTEYDVEPERTSLMILGPRQNFNEESIEFVDKFLQKGGKLVLADDFGSANSLLEGLNTTSSFNTSPLLELSFEKKPEFGVAYNVTEHQLTEDIDQVMLNSPTAIDKEENATTVMTSSKASWLDENENRIKDENESFEEYPLMTVEDYGEGELILVSDPSIFINSMQDRKDNRALSDNVLTYLSRGGSDIIFDESHREINFVYRSIFTGEYTGEPPTMIMGTLLILAGLGIGVYFGFTESKEILFRKIRRLVSHLVGEEEKEDPVGKVLNNNPDWDKDKLEMITERFIDVDKGDG